jgi:hypothetical protein
MAGERLNLIDAVEVQYKLQNATFTFMSTLEILRDLFEGLTPEQQDEYNRIVTEFNQLAARREHTWKDIESLAGATSEQKQKYISRVMAALEEEYISRVVAALERDAESLASLTSDFNRLVMVVLKR